MNWIVTRGLGGRFLATLGWGGSNIPTPGGPSIIRIAIWTRDQSYDEITDYVTRAQNRLITQFRRQGGA